MRVCSVGKNGSTHLVWSNYEEIEINWASSKLESVVGGQPIQVVPIQTCKVGVGSVSEPLISLSIYSDETVERGHLNENKIK